MNDRQARGLLVQLHAWVRDKLQRGQEPPWSAYEYMKLAEAAEEIVAGMDVVVTPEDSPRSEERSDTDAQPADCTAAPNIIPLRRGRQPYLRMPM